MHKILKPVFRLLMAAAIMLTSLASLTGVDIARAAGDLAIKVTQSTDCGAVEFTVSWDGTPDYLFEMEYGDGITSGELTLNSNSTTLNHIYFEPGEYDFIIRVEEIVEEGLTGSAVGIITIDIPVVTLSSTPFPPLVGPGDSVVFKPSTVGGTSPYTYNWDLGGDGDPVPDTDDISFTYAETGKYQAQVTVEDFNGCVATVTLPVVVADPEYACHPMAQKISDGVNKYLFPAYSEDLYTCDDIYAIFDNESEENNLGFGLMWKAYHLAESMEILTWEDIMDWKLDQGGWGALLQLDRFADLLDEHDLVELMGLVLSEDYTLGDVRIAVRSTTRFEADFTEVLARIDEDTNPGELGQFYKLANELGLGADLAVLDDYLADGLTLSELRHAANFADRMKVDDWTEILSMGIQEYKKSLLVDAQALREGKQTTRQEDRNQQTAKKLDEQFSAEAGDAWNLFTEDCVGNWGCVRKDLREQEQTQSEGNSEKDNQTIQQIVNKYGFSEKEIRERYDICEEDWACTRAYFRMQYLILYPKVHGKPAK